MNDLIPDTPAPTTQQRERLISLSLETLEAANKLTAIEFGLSGHVGNAVFACALAQIHSTVAAEETLDRALDVFNERGAGPSLHNGVAGLGFVLATYANASTLLCEIDKMLMDHVTRLPVASMQSGVAGIGLYASLRSETATGRELQRATLDTLKSAARPSDDGLIWDTPASYARGRGCEVLGEPVTEFGMVHGVAGTLVALSAMAKCGQGDAADLTRAGLRSVWALEGTAPNRFGRMDFGQHGAHGTLDLGDRWCVGDPGVLRALWLAANAVDDSAFAAKAVTRLRERASQTAIEPIPTTDRMDLCCGWAAIAQVYLQMYRDTGDAVFRDANHRTLSACNRVVEHTEHLGLRYGRMGILLALLSASTEEEMLWDQILGTSLPKRVDGRHAVIEF